MWLCSSLRSSQPGAPGVLSPNPTQSEWGEHLQHCPHHPGKPLTQNSQRTSPRASRAGGCRHEGTGNKYQSDFIGGRGTAAPSPGPGLLVLQTPFSSFPSSSSSSRRSRHTWHLERGAVQWHRRGILIPGGSLNLRAARGIGEGCGLTEGVGGHSGYQGVSRGSWSSRRGHPSTPNPWRGAKGGCGGKQELGQVVAAVLRGARG